MSDITVDASALKGGDARELDELKDYLSKRLGVTPAQSGSKLTITPSEEREVLPRDVKEEVKRFLYRRGLKPRYRVTATGRALTLRRTGPKS